MTKPGAPPDPNRPAPSGPGQPAAPTPAAPAHGQPSYPQAYGQPPYPGYPPQPYGQPPYPGYPPQPYGQPPYPQAYGQPPYPGYPPHAAPPGPPPAGAAPYGHPHAAPYPQPYPQPLPAAYAPPAPYVPKPPSVPGDSFASLLKLSFLRAIRLRIESDEVLPRERAALERAGVTEPSFQAFLAWRRSILLLVATLLIPLIALKAYEIYGHDDALPAPIADTLRSLHTIPLLAEIAFCVLAWTQLSRWTKWRQQRRVLGWAWMVYFFAPFVVYLYPMRSLMDDQLGDAGSVEAKGLGVLMGLMFSLQAMMTLAPKAVSLIPGMVRAATVTKLLFPGSAAPGWLVLLGAPIYAMFIYVVLIVPYQLTGSGYFVAAIVGIVVAEVLLGRGGYRLARPLTREQAIGAVRSTRRLYFIALAVSVLFMIAALGELVVQLEWSALNIVNVVFTFIANVWILTLITTDLLITGLDRARGLSAGTAQLAADFDRQLASFIGQKTVAMAAVTPPPGTDLPP